MTRALHSVANTQFRIESWKNTRGKFTANANVMAFVKIAGLQAMALHTT